MSRYKPGRSYGHYIENLTWYYEISWMVDFYYSGSRLRFPRRFRRFTDKAGAKRFCRKHGLALPEKTRKKI